MVLKPLIHARENLSDALKPQREVTKLYVKGLGEGIF